VWLEKIEGRERISAETQLVFAHPGAQDPVTFQEVQGKKVRLRFIHVPHGEVQAWVQGRNSTSDPISMRCRGADFSHEFTLAGGDSIQLTLRTAASAREKSGWRRLVEVGDESEITIDLGGSERSVRIESAELGTLEGLGVITLLRVEGGEAQLGQSVAVFCQAGRGITAVHIPNGRWLYRYDDNDQVVAAWGLVEVTTARQSGDELVLLPRLRLAPLAEIRAGIRLDEIEGVSLAKLPDKFRTVSAKGGSERVALPIDAKYVTLEGK